MDDPLSNIIIFFVLIFIGIALFWPGWGIFSRWKKLQVKADRIQREDALKHIQKLAISGESPTIRSMAGALEVSTRQAADVIADLETLALIQLHDGKWELTDDGERLAVQIIRAHRLLERFMADETGYQEAEWHLQAEAREHSLTPEEIEHLYETLGRPSYDPHGDPIPTSEGEIWRESGMPLTNLQVGQIARIVHIPDEPDNVAAEVQTEGLVPGMVLRVQEATSHNIKFQINGRVHTLTQVAANSIAVVLAGQEILDWMIQGEPLTVLNLGDQGEVTGISPRCRGQERRRLMDLGILPGTQITAEMVSPSGDPTAYRIRDALIALRHEQAELIKIKILSSERSA